MVVSKAGGSAESWCHDADGPTVSSLVSSGLGPRGSSPRTGLGIALCVVMLAGGVGPASAQDTTSTTESTSTTEASSSTTEASTSTTAATTSSTTEASSSTTGSSTSTSEPTSTTAGSSSTSPSTTSSSEASESDRQRLDAAESSKAREINAATARLDELNDALADLEADLEARSAEVDIANRRLTTAVATAQATQDEVAELEAQARQLEISLGDQAIRSYKGETADGTVLIGTDPSRAMRRQTLLAKATQSDIDYANLLASVREDLLARRRDAEDAVRRADASRAEGEAELTELEESRLAYGDLASAAESRIDHLLSERAALAQLGAEVDAGLDVDLDEELVARLAAASAGGSSRQVQAPITVSDGEIVSAGKGIMVHQSIADDVRQLLIDASAAGIELAGGGYRDPAQQIAVRKNNCGTSNYAIYQMPSSQCRPPTARPGRSMHEQGRAIDFTYNGRIISSRSSPAFVWLAANASKYGLYNLPSEPWHWSTNGR